MFSFPDSCDIFLRIVAFRLTGRPACVLSSATSMLASVCIEIVLIIGRPPFSPILVPKDKLEYLIFGLSVFSYLILAASICPILATSRHFNSERAEFLSALSLIAAAGFN